MVYKLVLLTAKSNRLKWSCRFKYSPHYDKEADGGYIAFV